ncbi:MAG: hypothetical protein U9O94_11450 [Nanoarchaeota archaeon]|nr:hypothetical protein [Nanoarchaeota archaeon]
MKSLEKFVAKNAKVILYSCETGKEGLKGENMLRFIATCLRGREVYGPEESITGVDYTLDENGKITGIIYIYISQDERTGAKTSIKTYKVIIE